MSFKLNLTEGIATVRIFNNAISYCFSKTFGHVETINNWNRLWSFKLPEIANNSIKRQKKENYAAMKLPNTFLDSLNEDLVNIKNINKTTVSGKRSSYSKFIDYSTMGYIKKNHNTSNLRQEYLTCIDKVFEFVIPSKKLINACEKMKEKVSDPSKIEAALALLYSDLSWRVSPEKGETVNINSIQIDIDAIAVKNSLSPRLLSTDVLTFERKDFLNYIHNDKIKKVFEFLKNKINVIEVALKLDQEDKKETNWGVRYKFPLHNFHGKKGITQMKNKEKNLYIAIPNESNSYLLNISISDGNKDGISGER